MLAYRYEPCLITSIICMIQFRQLHLLSPDSLNLYLLPWLKLKVTALWSSHPQPNLTWLRHQMKSFLQSANQCISDLQVLPILPLLFQRVGSDYPQSQLNSHIVLMSTAPTQTVVSEYHSFLKRKQNLLEKWIIPGLRKKMNKVNLEHYHRGSKTLDWYPTTGFCNGRSKLEGIHLTENLNTLDCHTNT